MSLPKIIALTGHIGAGKTTVARILKTQGYTRVRFAGPLKSMLHAIGLLEAETDGHKKEQPCEILCGKTPRQAMQTLGTEWGRDHIGPNFWINLWKRDARRHDFVVVDDVRFQNEIDAVHDLGGVVWRVIRAEVLNHHSHASEQATLPFDHAITNDWSMDELRGSVLESLALYGASGNFCPVRVPAELDPTDGA